MSGLDQMVELGQWAVAAGDRSIDEWLKGQDHASELSLSFCEEWAKTGCQIYELRHSIAALLAATRSPDLVFDRLPHHSFVVKVPAAFLPIEGNQSADVLICVNAIDDVTQIGIWYPSVNSAGWSAVVGDQSISESYLPAIEVAKKREWLLAIRMVSNVVAFITEHRECVERITSNNAHRTVHNVRPPRDVVIDRAFRDRVSDLVRAGTRAEVSSALAHMVRGHWRNQAVGRDRANRRLTWVRPHRRGDESLGVVVKRTERIP